MSITETQDRLEVVHDDQPQQASPASEAGPWIRPTFTITDAATACAVSRKTITRKLVELGRHGAAKDEDGIWRIPVEALLAVGLHPGRSVPEAQQPNPGRPVTSSANVASRPDSAEIVSVPRDRWDDLRIRLARAEAQAAERELALADARLALRALTAGPGAAVPSAAPPQSPQSPQSPQALESPLATHSPGVSAVIQGASADRQHGGGDGSLSDAGLHAEGARVHEPASSPPAASPSEREPQVPSDRGVAVEPLGAGPAATIPSPQTPVPDVALASARSHAARHGGHVPAVGQGGPVKKRRWWQSS